MQSRTPEARVVHIDPDRQADAQRITAQLGRLGLVLPGTVLHRQARCGQPRCRCHADPPALHRPFWSWTRKIAGKTLTRRLTDEQLRDYQPWFDNARQLRELTSQLEALTLTIVDDDPRWGAK